MGLPIARHTNRPLHNRIQTHGICVLGWRPYAVALRTKDTEAEKGVQRSPRIRLLSLSPHVFAFVMVCGRSAGGGYCRVSQGRSTCIRRNHAFASFIF